MIRSENTGGIVANIAELWEYRELFYFFIWRDVKVRYAQSVLGIGWATRAAALSHDDLHDRVWESRQDWIRWDPLRPVQLCRTSPMDLLFERAE